jgi:hypothetical protein
MQRLIETLIPLDSESTWTFSLTMRTIRSVEGLVIIYWRNLGLFIKQKTNVSDQYNI